MSRVPVITTATQRDDYLAECGAADKPAVWINKIRGWKWCCIHVDFRPTGEDDTFRGVEVLTDDGRAALSEVCDAYREKMRPVLSGTGLSAEALNFERGTRTIRLPDMQQPAAETLGNDIQPIVDDSANRVALVEISVSQ